MSVALRAVLGRELSVKDRSSRSDEVMSYALAVGIPLAVLGLLAASIWYVSFRLRTLFGIERRLSIRLGPPQR